MKRIITHVTLIALAVILFCVAGPSLSFSQETTVVKVERLLNQTGYNVVKKTNNVWFINFTGKNSPPFKVVISTDQDEVTDIVIFVTLIKKNSFVHSVEALSNLLKYNHKIDRVKVGFDSDEDVSVRVDCSSRIVDVPELKAIIQQIAAASDEIYGGMKPFLTTAR